MLKKIVLILLTLNSTFGNPAPEGRIVGGGNAGLGQMPYMASIRNWGSTFHFSGGVIISDRWILSSANYLNGRADDSLNIVMGIIDLTATGVSRRSERIVMHPFFNSNTRENDIACIMMEGPALIFSNTVNAIFMVSELIGVPVSAITAGWGSTNPNMGENSQMLRRLDVMTSSCANRNRHEDLQDDEIQRGPMNFDIPTAQTPPPPPTQIPTTTTTQTPTTTIPPGDLFSTRICARALTTGGICSSDVGGPLVTMSGLIGISSSHPIPCASQPDVYMRISWYRNWIGSVVGV